MRPPPAGSWRKLQQAVKPANAGADVLHRVDIRIK
jgi:hypothetical protein